MMNTGVRGRIFDCEVKLITLQPQAICDMTYGFLRLNAHLKQNVIDCNMWIRIIQPALVWTFVLVS